MKEQRAGRVWLFVAALLGVLGGDAKGYFAGKHAADLWWQAHQVKCEGQAVEVVPISDDQKKYAPCQRIVKVYVWKDNEAFAKYEEGGEGSIACWGKKP